MIPCYACNATGATLLQLDDPTVDTDQGVPFVASLTTAAFDQGPASGYGTLRRLTQAIGIAGATTVVITPVGDGSEYTDQASTQTLVTTDGTEQELEVPVFVPATRYQLLLRITAHVGLTWLGEADQWFVPRRTTRR